jgi:hypothetical protein|tara:strand:+ start:1281 stop:1499 length:219 start_codon:yes stop_codon:yes gene_type:complete
MAKKEINEGLFGAAKKFSDAFFDGLKTNSTNIALKKAKQKGFPPEIQKQMDRVNKESEKLRSQLKGYTHKVR